MEVIFWLTFLLSMVFAQDEIVISPTTAVSAVSDDLTSAEIRDENNRIVLNEEDKVSSVLRLIESQRKNCTPGTELNLVGVVDQYGVKKFSGEAKIALNRANLLTRWWKHSPGIFFSTDPIIRNQTEYLLYAAVRTMVELNENIYSAGNCYDWHRYPHYPLFCPFAHRLPSGDEILTKDLAIAYEYDDQMEWFGTPKSKGISAINRSLNESASNSQIRKGLNCFRYNNVTEDILLVDYNDGHWSKPYYDCGGGNIWMMTYTVPFFGYNDTTHQYHFMGTSGIDIDLRNVDIDQCPLKENSTEQNVFAGSSKCKPTTECDPIPGLGFSRGSYKCICLAGYYFPDTSAYDASRAYFHGVIIEQEYEKRQQGLNNTYDSGFTCLPCSQGCDVCTDPTPCIVQLNWTLRTAILVAASVVMACLPVLFYFTFRYAEVKVIKAASPVLLRMVLLGALFLYGPIVVLFPLPTLITCTSRIWLRGIGFSVSYGALLLKTWRISVVFRVRSAQRVKITDTNLVKRLIGLVGIFASYLTIRTVVSPPRVLTGFKDKNLKAFLCTTDYWDYCQAGGELLLLLWGIKLCFVVRKAPSEFNESKFISWAIYNEFLLSLFLNISMLFLQKYADPDLLYIIFFAHSQLTTTVVLVLLFGSKAYMVYKGLGKTAEQTTAINAEQTRSSNKFITKKTQRTNIPLTSSSMSQSNATVANHDSYKGTLPGHLTPGEIQEEFKRLYLQLEMLKSKNMRLGNPHLTKKLCAMTEAAMANDPSFQTDSSTAAGILSSMLGSITPATPSSPSNDTSELIGTAEESTVGQAEEPTVETALLPVPSPLMISKPQLIPNSHDAVPVLPPPFQSPPVQSPSEVSLPSPVSVASIGPSSNHVPVGNFNLRNSKKVFEITI